jgi:hypothetical protein
VNDHIDLGRIGELEEVMGADTAAIGPAPKRTTSRYELSWISPHATQRSAAVPSQCALTGSLDHGPEAHNFGGARVTPSQWRAMHTTVSEPSGSWWTSNACMLPWVASVSAQRRQPVPLVGERTAAHKIDGGFLSSQNRIGSPRVSCATRRSA